MYWVLPTLGITTALAVLAAFIPGLPEAIVLWGRYECLALIAFYVISSIVMVARGPNGPSMQGLHPFVVVVGALQVPWGLIIVPMLLILPLIYTVLHYVQII